MGKKIDNYTPPVSFVQHFSQSFISILSILQRDYSVPVYLPTCPDTYDLSLMHDRIFTAISSPLEDKRLKLRCDNYILMQYKGEEGLLGAYAIR
jgi:hypothetical protein